MGEDMPVQYEFSNNWFQTAAKANWDRLIPLLLPGRVLEIGCFEGASTCYLIDVLGAKKPLEIHCIDPWAGYDEMPGHDLSIAEGCFDRNTARAINAAAYPVEVVKRKGFSQQQLPRLVTEGKENYFDFIYIDGTHKAPEVLFDAVLCFRLLKSGGVMVFDDYLWSEKLPGGADLLRCPKPAIDAFTNLYCRKLRVLGLPLYQLYVQKLSD